MTGLTDDPFENPEHLANTADAMGRACKDWQESTAHYHFACRDTIRALHAQLAEAQAAQAALVERAAEVVPPGYFNHEEEWAAWRSAQHLIRRLAPDAGVKALAELRAENKRLTDAVIDAGDDRDRLAAKLAEAEARGMERAAKICEGIRTRIANGPMPEGARFDYEHAIRAEAAAMKGETT